jgi:hypothetical protein
MEHYDLSFDQFNRDMNNMGFYYSMTEKVKYEMVDIIQYYNDHQEEGWNNAVHSKTGISLAEEIDRYEMPCMPAGVSLTPENYIRMFRYNKKPNKKKKKISKMDKKAEKKGKMEKARKNADNNWAELICAICMALFIEGKDKPTVQHILNSTQEEISTKFKCPKGFLSYKEDLSQRKKHIVTKYLDRFWKVIPELIPEDKRSNIKEILLSGKICENNIIGNKHRNIKNKRKSCKADIYIIDKDNKVIGLSVKDTPNAPRTNYSVQKIFDDLGIIKDNDLNKVKMDYLREQLSDRWPLQEAKRILAKGTKEQKKDLRKVLNPLFYRKSGIDNEYFRIIDELIMSNQTKILIYLYSSTLGEELKYPIYEFNGKDLMDLKNNAKGLKKKNMRLVRYKLDNTTSAKLYYSVIEGDNIKDRIEIRFKGNILQSSPQFLLMKVIPIERKRINARLQELNTEG